MIFSDIRDQIDIIDVMIVNLQRKNYPKNFLILDSERDVLSYL